jgi:hypothetical protein
MTKLQREQLKAELFAQAEAETCNFCWKTSCGCPSLNIQDDPFINMTEGYEIDREIQYV